MKCVQQHRGQWVLVVFLEEDVLSHPIPLEEVEDASGRNGVEADLQEREECRAPDDAEGIMRSAVIVRRSENRKELVESYNCVMEIIKREKQEAERKNTFSIWKIVKVVVVGGLAVAAAPLALSVAGFSGGSIVAGSLAARLMSVAAVANGGGVAAASAGGWIAALQSASAAGLSFSTNALIGSTAGGAFAMLDREKPPEDNDTVKKIFQIEKAETMVNKTTEGNQTKDSDRPSEDTTQVRDSDRPSKGTTQVRDSDRPSEDTAQVRDSDRPSKDTTQVRDSDRPSKGTTQVRDSDRPSKDTTQVRDSDRPSKDTTQVSDSNGCNAAQVHISNCPSGDTKQ